MTTTKRIYPTYTQDRLDDRVDPDHHIWRNGRTWWLAVTLHFEDGTVRRIRRSLGTSDVHAGRARRDELLAAIDALPGVSLSLRYARCVP